MRATSVECEQRTVTRAYHLLCDNCARAAHCCAKCRAADGAVRPIETAGERRAREAAEAERLALMSERERRTYLRLAARRDAADDASASDEPRAAASAPPAVLIVEAGDADVAVAADDAGDAAAGDGDAAAATDDDDDDEEDFNPF